MDALFCTAAPEKVLGRCGAPEIFNEEQGGKFTSSRLTDMQTDSGVRISLDGHGHRMDNGFIERLWRSVK